MRGAAEKLEEQNSNRRNGGRLLNVSRLEGRMRVLRRAVAADPIGNGQT